VLNHVGAAEDPLPPNAVRAELSRDPAGPFLGCADDRGGLSGADQI
jgi:hypothetical protein